MSAKINIDIISDIVCPWCIVGYQRLKQAIKELDIEDRIELEWQPFELNTTISSEGEDLSEHLSLKYGSTAKEMKANKEQITKLGAQMKFRFDFFAGMRIVNTRDAHILLDYAREHGKQTEFKVRLFNAYFNERKDISDTKILVQEIIKIGLSGEDAVLVLENKESLQKLRNTESKWKIMGVSSVPTIIFNQKNAISGAQSVEMYKQILREM